MVTAKYRTHCGPDDQVDTPSKLIVTTRIRGLIKGGNEVAIGNLSLQEALQLLAATAEVDEYVPPQEEGEGEDDDQYRLACEVIVPVTTPARTSACAHAHARAHTPQGRELVRASGPHGEYRGRDDQRGRRNNRLVLY